MITQFTDPDGHTYEKRNDLSLWLTLKGKPCSGKRVRYLGRISSRGLYLERLERGWYIATECWKVAYYLLKNREELKFELVHMVGWHPSGKRSGWVHPEILIENAYVKHQKQGFELQVELRPSDLCNSKEEAWEAYERFLVRKNPPPPPPNPQRELFAE